MKRKRKRPIAVEYLGGAMDGRGTLGVATQIVEHYTAPHRWVRYRLAGWKQDPDGTAVAVYACEWYPYADAERGVPF